MGAPVSCCLRSLTRKPFLLQEDERDESEPPASTQRLREDDPQAILDNHLSRVLRTPGCQSPGTLAGHSPRSRSPEPRRPSTIRPGGGGVGGRAFVSKHVHHHYIHHHSVPKSKEQLEVEAARRVQGMCPATPDCCPSSTYARSRSLGHEHGSGVVEATQG